MQQTVFQALVVEAAGKTRFTRTIREKSIDDLPPGDVLIRVAFSSLNYKDALSATGNRGVTRDYPHTPGIDAAGVVAESASDLFKCGDPVLVTGYDLGMNTAGGFGQYIRVPAGWVVSLPAGLSLRESMGLGTAGFTAGLSVAALTESVPPERGEILVTGATGGVGSLATAILARLGYAVTGVSGKPEGNQFLTGLGATGAIDRDQAIDTSGRPMLKARWAGVIDTVGGDILATAIKSTHPWGTVTCCGMVASADLPLNVFPFILRGVRLIGIDSQNCPMPLRRSVWDKLATPWKPDCLDQLIREVPLAQLDPQIDLILKGKQKGRVIVNLE